MKECRQGPFDPYDEKIFGKWKTYKFGGTKRIEHNKSTNYDEGSRVETYGLVRYAWDWRHAGRELTH